MYNTKNNRELNIAWQTTRAEILRPVLLITIDYLMIVMAELIVLKLISLCPESIGNLSLKPAYLYGYIPAVFLAFLEIHGRDVLECRPLWHMFRGSFWAVVYAVVACMALFYMTGSKSNVSVPIICGIGIFAYFLAVCGRYSCKKLIILLNILQLPVIFVGAGKSAERILAGFEDDIGYGYKIVGFIDDKPASKIIPKRYRVLGGFSNADRIIRLLGVSYVVIAAPSLSKERQVSLVNKIQPYVKSVAFVPDVLCSAGNLRIVNLLDTDLMLIDVRNNLSYKYNRLAKRIFDLILCTTGMVVFIPLTVVLGIIIYASDPGPIFFSHRRVGRGGKEFPCYKFRSMVINSKEILERHLAENPAVRKEWHENFKLKNDPRVTKIGAFLRKTSLDELPQLLNVLKGEMSLVGPRPIIKAEIEKYGEFINDYYRVMPGITGVWQVNGRSDTTYEERVAMDSWYVHNWSVWIDLLYLVKTIKVVLERKGAY